MSATSAFSKTRFATGGADFLRDFLGLFRMRAEINPDVRPCLASSIATARPMPREAPVTRAFFPFNFMNNL